MRLFRARKLRKFIIKTFEIKKSDLITGMYYKGKYRLLFKSEYAGHLMRVTAYFVEKYIEYDIHYIKPSTIK